MLCHEITHPQLPPARQAGTMEASWFAKYRRNAMKKDK